MNWSPDLSRMWLTRPDGSPTERRSDEVFSANVKYGGTLLEFFDTTCRVYVDSVNPQVAVEEARENLEYLLRVFLSTTSGVGTLLTAHIIGVNENGLSLRRNESQPLKFHVYQNQKLAESVIESATNYLSVQPDQRLEKSLMYLGVGDALNGLIKADEQHTYTAEVLPLRFLQYWKALTVILGDPSRDSKDHQSRPKLIGLDRTYFRNRVLPLNKIRDSLDVAHSIDLRRGQRVRDDQVDDCRNTASEVIRMYLEFLRNRS